MISAYITLSRPLNVTISILSILLAGIICNDEIKLPLVLASLAGGMIAAAANAWNDFFDVEIDRINKPYRPLPSGKLSTRQALLFANTCGTMGLFLTLFVNQTCFLIAFFALLLLFGYSAKLKRTVLWGNITVGVMTALAFIFGAVAVGSWQCALVPAVFAFLMHLGREILKDMEDVPGDKQLEAKTLPVVYGLRSAKIAISMIFIVLIIATLLPYFLNIYGVYYLFIVIIGVDTILFYVLIKIWRQSDPVTLHRLSELLKYDMLIGILAIYCGGW